MKYYQARRLLARKFLLGESPVYHPSSGILSWVDIKTGTLFELEETGKLFQVQTGQYLGAAVPYETGEAYVGVMTTGIYKIQRNKIKRLYGLDQIFGDGRRANDAKCSPNGRLWFGSMPLFEGSMELGGGLYCYSGSEVYEKISGTKVANGMAWSDNEKKFYFIDSVDRCVYEYDYIQDGEKIKDRRRCIDISLGIPDGMAIDCEGMLWIALWGTGRIGRFHPDTGVIQSIVEVPAKNVSSCCFGGEKLDILFITSSAEGLTGGEEGCVFSCRVEVPGKPDSFWKG